MVRSPLRAALGWSYFVIVFLALTAYAIRPSNIPSLKSPIALQKPRIGAKIYSEDVFDIHPISAIPGYTDDQLPGQMYSGYISVGHGKHLYFIFYVHPSPYKQPVVVWMNGGPGCSSMDGFVYEHGPFIFAPGEPTVDTPDPLPVLSRNPFGWHEHASVMWVDSPAGVGNSYCEDDDCLHTGDKQTAEDMEVFVRMAVDFFDLDEIPVYIAGESYAGIYVPTLVSAILDGNAASKAPLIKLEGYMVGNGCTDKHYDHHALLPFAVGKSLISRDMYHWAKKDCKHDDAADPDSDRCEDSMSMVWEVLADLDIYDVLSPCYHRPAESRANRRRAMTVSDGAPSWPLAGAVPEGRVLNWAHLSSDARVEALSKAGAKGCTSVGCVGPSGDLGTAVGDEGEGGSDGDDDDDDDDGLVVPCTDDTLARRWLNDEGVRAAMHIKPVEEIGRWSMCNGDVNFHFDHDAGSMLPYHKRHLQQGLRVLIYSGDHDMAVPHTGSEKWTADLADDLDLEEIRGWRPWEVDGQVAGFCVTWEGMEYVTVKGAGHMVPQNKPAEAGEMLRRFLGKEMCDGKRGLATVDEL